jgi:hypothetical protein
VYYTYGNPSCAATQYWQDNAKTYTPYDIGSDEFHNFTIRSYEWMNDEPTGAGRPFKAVMHKKITASRLLASTLESFNHLDKSLGYGCYAHMWMTCPNDICVTPLNVSGIWNAATSEIAVASWVSQFTTLADLVRGLVDSKTLIGVSVKELPKTIRMVRNPFGLLKTDWRKIAKNLSARKLAERGADLWLEYQYGWKATYRDLDEFTKSSSKFIASIRRYQDQGSERFSKSAVSSLSPFPPTLTEADWVSLENQANNWSWGSRAIPPFRIVFMPGTVKTSVSCQADCSISNGTSKFEKFAHAYGLTPKKLLDSLWEVLPYSFVVDWFVNSQAIRDLLSFSSAVQTLSQQGIRNLGYSAKVEYPFVAETIKQWSSNYYGSKFDGCWSSNPPPLGAQPNRVRGLPGCVSQYQRWAGVPPSSISILSGKGLSLTQGVSGLSLLIQRLSRRH